MANKFLNIRDMLDGGGAGASGAEFKGGSMSNILNALGIKPAGYRDRAGGMGQAAPQRPPRVNRAPTPVAAAQPAPMPVNRDYGYGGPSPLNTPASMHTRKAPMLEPVLPPAAPSVMSTAPTMTPRVSPEQLGTMPPAPMDPAITSRMPTTAGPDSKSFASFISYLKANGVEFESVPHDKLSAFYNAWKNVGGI
jgi:hypothetical protein